MPNSDGKFDDKYGYVSIFMDIKSIDMKTKISRKKCIENLKKKLCKCKKL